MDPVHLGENEDKRKLIRIAANGELAGDFRMSLLCLLSKIRFSSELINASC